MVGEAEEPVDCRLKQRRVKVLFAIVRLLLSGILSHIVSRVTNSLYLKPFTLATEGVLLALISARVGGDTHIPWLHAGMGAWLGPQTRGGLNHFEKRSADLRAIRPFGVVYFERAPLRFL